MRIIAPDGPWRVSHRGFYDKIAYTLALAVSGRIECKADSRSGHVETLSARESPENQFVSAKPLTSGVCGIPSQEIRRFLHLTGARSSLAPYQARVLLLTGARRRHPNNAIRRAIAWPCLPGCSLARKYVSPFFLPSRSLDNDTPKKWRTRRPRVFAAAPSIAEKRSKNRRFRQLR